MRPDQLGDRGLEYRNLVGFKGGAKNAELAAQLVDASKETGDQLDFAVGKGTDRDIPRVVWIMDSDAYPSYVAEQYHQVSSEVCLLSSRYWNVLFSRRNCVIQSLTHSFTSINGFSFTMVLTLAKTTQIHITTLRENSPKLGKILDLVLVFRNENTIDAFFFDLVKFRKNVNFPMLFRVLSCILISFF